MKKKLTFTSDSCQLASVRQKAREFLTDCGYEECGAELPVLAIDEACTNIIRHAGARTVRTQITVAADSLSLSVSDDGRGFAQAAGEGFGLRNIRQRTEAVAGAATIRSGAAGTTVTIAMPRTCG